MEQSRIEDLERIANDNVADTTVTYMIAKNLKGTGLKLYWDGTRWFIIKAQPADQSGNTLKDISGMRYPDR